VVAQLVASRVVLSSTELDDVRTSQVTPIHLRSVMGIALLFYMQIMFVPHSEHAYRPPRPVTGIALLFYMQIMFVPYSKHTNKSPWPVTGISSLYIYIINMYILVYFIKSERSGRLNGCYQRPPGTAVSGLVAVCCPLVRYRAKSYIAKAKWVGCTRTCR
jgi:hypothetical protein